MATLASGKLSEMFEDFLKSVTDRSGAYIYRTKISLLIASEGKSLVVDFGDLLRYNGDLANRILLEPDSSLGSFKVAAFETMRSENALYADRVKRELTVRIRGVPDLVPLRKVDTSFLDRMVAVSGMVVRTSELRPLMTSAAWVCPSGHLTYQDQDEMALKKPPRCELCGEVRNFELDRKHSRFIDFQVLRVQELPEELPPGQLPQFFDVNAEGDIVNLARPGDRVVLTGVVRAVQDYSPGQVRTRLFRSQIDCNHVEVRGKEPEQVQITKEDEALIKSIAGSSDAYEKLIGSIAPVILGHNAEKEAILLLLAGGSATLLPDGTKLRGDINTLFVGDPGCLVADERIVLGNGAIQKISQLGQRHLQPIDLQVLTGEGGGHREWATRFHMYRKQPVIEVVTESGKSVKGTLNHPLLRFRNEDGKLVKEWCRLDRLRVGDRLATVTGFPCTITELVKTGFAPLSASRYGPRFMGRLPDRMTPELAAFCGYMLGDGWVDLDGYGFGFVVAEPDVDILPKLLDLTRSLFGIRAEPHTRTRKDRTVPMHYVYLGSRDVAANLKFLRQKRVPDSILVSGNKVVSSFLSWLFEADGTVFSKGRGARAVGLKAKDVELLRDVQLLLLRFGIHSRIVGNALLIRRGEDIAKFSREVGFVSRRKKEILSGLTEVALKTGRVHRQMSERIVKIVQHGLEDVYDIEVPRGHRFIANGIVSHNTGKSELLKFASQVAPRGLYASGRGTTAAGLSAAVIREKNVLMLEAGVVVLADLGIACIDEFEKMKPEDRTALHEMMEQQSYHASTEIMFADGSKRKIGDFVDEYFQTKTQSVIQGKDCQVVPLSGEVSLRSLTPDGADFDARVDRVSRHEAPDSFVRIRFSNGRTIIVTPEHPVFTYMGGKITTIPASELRGGEFVPAPIRVGYVPQRTNLVQVRSSPGSKVILQQLSLSPSLGRVLGYLISEGNFYRGRTTEIDFGNFNQDFMRDMRANADALFGFEPIVRTTGGIQTCLRYVSKTLLDWFEANFPEMVQGARQKRIPRKISAAPKEVAREFLASAYLGDGGVESTALCYRTASKGLAEDYQDLLLRFGIASRIVLDKSNESYKVYIMGESMRQFFETIVEKIDPRYDKIKKMVDRSTRTERSHDAFPTEIARDLISIKKGLGLSYDGSYHRHLARGYGISRRTLTKEVQTLWARMEEVSGALADGKRTPHKLRKALGISQDRFAGLAGLKRGEIAYLEACGYDEATRAKLVERVESAVVQHLEQSKEGLLQIKNLMSFKFLRVRNVETVRNEGELKSRWVYDVTVEPTHSFVSSGLLLHNTVTIAKGGIYATLNARTAILAACNPVLGRYNPFQNLTENIGTLPIPLLSRFDLIFVFRDQPTPAEDERLASHILAVHAKRSYTTPPPIEFSLLKKYLAYAKKISPDLTKDAMERLKDFYLDLRKASGSEESIPPTPRTLEALIRVATARARVLLRDEVIEEDALAAIALMNRMVEDVLTDATTKKTDFGIQLGKPVGETKNLKAAMEVFKTLEGTERKPVERKAFKEELVKARFTEEDAEKMIRTMFREGLVYESKPGFIRRLGG